MPRIMMVNPADGIHGHAGDDLRHLRRQHLLRRIFTDGRDLPKDDRADLPGYSIGKWIDTDGDGQYDTLEVETRGFKGPRTYEIDWHPAARGQPVDVQGTHLSRQEQSDILHNEITAIDNALTRPWTVDKRYRARSQSARRLARNRSVAEDNAMVVIGGENYFLSADGLLMPAKKGQSPPDLRHFDKTRE